MDISGLSGIMRGVGGCFVDYEFTRFASIDHHYIKLFLVVKKIKFRLF